MSAPLSVALIGAGAIAKAHVTNLQQIPGVEVVACADPDPAALLRMREVHGIARGYRDHRELLAGEARLDAVCVCTPNGLHAEVAIAALRAGCHVLVEKPMAMDAGQASAMVAAAAACDRRLVVGFQFRFDPRTQALKRLVDAGGFGRVLHVRCQALRRRGIPNRGVFGRKELQGGGPLIDIGVHVLEMAHYLLGSPQPLSASGATWTYLGDRPMDALARWPDWDWRTYTVEDLAVGLVRFAGGATLAIESSFAAHIERDEWNLQLRGTQAGADWDPLRVIAERDGRLVDASPLDIGEWHVFAHKMRHFVGVCRGEVDNQASGEQGVMVQQILDGIYASAAQRREVPIGACQAAVAAG